ncbi:WxL domain-containing protein, partial [Enterococcus pallens]
SNVWSQYPTEGRGFTTKCIPLNIPPPTFDTDTITSHSITFEDGDYTGDITTTPNQGILTVTDGLTPIEYTLNHQTIYNGTYFGRVADNLQPGTRYRGNVTLTDYDGNTKASSLSEEFQTANTVETPHLFTLGDPPELGNEATVTLTARYGAADGSKGAHPEDYTWDSANNSWKNVQVEISKTGDETGFNRITDGTPEGRISHLEPPVVDTINKTVTFKVSKLAIKQDYWIRCQVRNQSGKWSGYPTKGKYIRTPGLKLTLNAPKFKQDTATDTSIDMEGQQYFGDITQFNGGGIVTVTPNNGGILENKVTNLMHMQNQGNSWNPQFYGSVTIGNLEPGTQYKGKVSIKDSIEEYRHSPWGGKDGIDTFFYTKNRVMALSEPMQETPTSINGAVATFTAGYKAADSNPAYVPAHPTKVKVYLSTDDNSFDEITTSSLGPRLVADNNIDTLNKLTTFRLEGLQENTVYFVKYSVVNDGGESAKSTSYRFETLSRPDGLYINESAADFNFGTVGFSSSNSTHPLEDTSGNETAVDFENININSNWSLSAKLSELKVEGETHLKLVGSSITMNNQLERSTDGGTTWTSADSTKFASGLNTTGPITLMADGSTSVELFKTTDISYGQSRFKNKIPLSSVSLFIPGNQGMKGKTYEGKITWTLDDTL